MKHEMSLRIAFCIFFSLCNIAVSTLYYLYGYFFERKLRKHETRIKLPESMLALFRFKGVYGTDKTRASRSGSLAQVFAVAYFLIMELVCFAMTVISNDATKPCRFAFSMLLALMAIGFIGLLIKNVQIRRNLVEIDIRSEENFVEEDAIDKQNANIEESDIFKENELKELKLNSRLEQIWEVEIERKNEATDIDEGKAAVKALNEDLVGNYFVIKKKAADKQNAENEGSGVLKDNDSENKTAGIDEGKAAIKALNEDLIGDHFFAKKTEAKKQNAEKGEGGISREDNDSENKTAGIDEGKAVIKALNEDLIGDHYFAKKTEAEKQNAEKGEGGISKEYNDSENKTAGIDEGKAAIKALNEDLIGNFFAIGDNKRQQ